MKSIWPTKKLGEASTSLNSKIKMQKTKLKLEIIKIENNEWKLLVLPGEYFTSEEYIGNLIEQLKSDVFPLFKVAGSAPFTISRNVFCFIDHISALLFGIQKKRGEQTERIIKTIFEFAKFDTYINSKYKKYAEYIVQIYRHDLVHNVRPLPKIIKIIEKKEQKLKKGITWFYISSEIHPRAPKSFNSLKRYFNNTKNRKNLFHLRYIGNQIYVNNYCLFFDLVNFLDGLEKCVENDNRLATKIALNYKKIVKNNLNKIENFILDKNKDKEVKFS